MANEREGELTEPLRLLRDLLGGVVALAHLAHRQAARPQVPVERVPQHEAAMVPIGRFNLHDRRGFVVELGRLFCVSKVGKRILAGLDVLEWHVRTLPVDVAEGAVRLPVRVRL